MLKQHRVAFLKVRAYGAGQAELESIRRSGRRTLLLHTLFLPVIWTIDRPFPNYPGSRYTQGEALVGFVVTLSVLAGIVCVVLSQWALLGGCAYWWLGAKILQGELRAHGRDV